MNKKLLSVMFGGIMLLSGGFLAGCDGAPTPEELSNYLSHGEAEPTEKTSAVGTYYYETDTGNVWYRYEDKGWTIISNLKGEKGDQGEKGDKGDAAETPEYIIEKEYNLLNMFVIVDNTDIPGYHQYTPGQFVNNLTGTIEIADCSVNVGKDKAELKYVKSDNENVAVATYTFTIVDKNAAQPTYTYYGLEVTLNGEKVVDFTDETLNLLMSVDDVITNDYIYRSGITSVQLISQDTSFSAYFNLKDSTTNNPILITQIYGY